MEIQPLPKKILTNHDTILTMIEEANIEGILLEENVDGFNELMKFELISIMDGQVHLTENGKKAKQEGVQAVIERLRSESTPFKVPQPAPNDRTAYYLLFFLLLLVIVLITGLSV